MKQNRFHLAGAVPWRKTEDGLEILLITARDRPLDDDNFWWIVPQGGVEPGQTAQEAAIAETWEEGGVRGVASSEPIARYEYDIGAGRCKVDIFEIEVEIVEDDWPESHERKRVWLSPEDALETISGHTLKSILEEFLRKKGD